MWKLENLAWGQPNCIYLCTSLVVKALGSGSPEVVVVGSSLQLNSICDQKDKRKSKGSLL